MLTLLLPAFASSPGPLRKDPVKYPRGGEGAATCEVALLVGVDGETDGVLVSGCEGSFDASTREAFHKWRWTPEAEPVEFWQRYEVRFNQSQPYAKIATAGREAEGFAEWVTVMHRSELPPTGGEMPGYPSKADGTDAKCKVTLWIRTQTGVTDGLAVDGCDEVFHDSTRRALLKWTWPAQPMLETEWVRTALPISFVKPAPPVPLEDWGDLLTVDSRVEPVPPKKWKKHVPTACRVTVVITAEGGVEDVVASGCPDIFVAPTENAVRQWTWSHVGEPERRWIALEVPYERLP